MSTAMQRLIQDSKKVEGNTTAHPNSKEAIVESDINSDKEDIKAKPQQKAEPKAETKPQISDEEELDIETVKQRTTESMEDEIKKLRKENAEKRIAAKQAEELAQKLLDEKQKEFEAKTKDLEDKAKRYEEIERAKLESNKTAEEKLNARELELKQLSDQVEAEKKAKFEAEKKLNEIFEEQRKEKEIRDQVLQNRITDVLKTIPEDKKKFAEALVNGYKDKQDALMGLLEAKQNNLFGTKKVEVAHMTPKGGDKQPQASDNLNYKQKMKRGLAQTRDGMKPGAKLV